jgi:hypothetical protein
MKGYQIRNPHEALKFKQEFAEEHSGCVEYKGNPELARAAFKMRLQAKLRSSKSLVEQILARRRKQAA